MITVVTCTMRESMRENVIANFLRQSYEPKECIILLNNNALDVEEWRKRVRGFQNIRIVQLEESMTLGDCLNVGIDLAKGDIIAKFDDDDFYSSQYLHQSLRTLSNSGASVVGKSSVFVYFKKEEYLGIFRENQEHCFIKNMRLLKKHPLAGGTLVFEKSIAGKVTFNSLNEGEDIQFQQDCLKHRLALYSGDKEHYLLIRYPNVHHHSWQVDDVKLQQSCRLFSYTSSPESLITGSERE